MTAAYVRLLHDHATWANEQVFAAAARLAPDEFRAAEHVSFGSIRDALVHVVGVERLWLARSRGNASPGDLDPARFPDVASLRAAWLGIDAELHAFVADLDDAALERVVRYENARGEPNAYLLWQILVHQTIHAGQHRGEVALLLTELGHSPGWLDFLYFLDERGLAQPG